MSISFVTHLQCSGCRMSLEAGRVQTLCPACHSPLLVRYDLPAVKRHLRPDRLCLRRPDMWRYREVLPLDQEDPVTLGEGFTPLLRLQRLGSSREFSSLYLKDESLNPTGSFKARGLSAAVSMARRLGITKLAILTAGNAGGALAAYGARAALQVYVTMPEDSPAANVAEVRLAGARLELVPGSISDAARRVAALQQQEGWFDVSTLREPYRIEGKKTMGYELAEQLGWRLPDVVLYPTGGGTGLIGMWKAFQEMAELGWIEARRPRMVVVQALGCAPLVKAFGQGRSRVQAWPSPHTLASGLRVPRPLGDFLILQILRESRGTAVAVSDAQIYQALEEVAQAEGALLAPEGAAGWAALKVLREQNWLQGTEQVVLFNTGSGLKYIDVLQRWRQEGVDSEGVKN